MKKYNELVIEVVNYSELDVICNSGPLKAGEFDDSDFWNE